MASTGEANIFRLSFGLIRPLPGGLGPVDSQRMKEIRALLDMLQVTFTRKNKDGQLLSEQNNVMVMDIFKELYEIVTDRKKMEGARPILAEFASVAQMVAVEILEIRGSRAMRKTLGIV